MKKSILILSLGLLTSVTTMHAQDIINPVAATTTLSSMFGSTLDNTINGAGLDMFPSLTGIHEATTPNNSFYAMNETGSIDFDLGGSYRVDGLTFWNINAPGPGQAGIQEVIISASEDGVTYTPIAGAPASFSQVVTPTSPAEMFTFTEVTASFIRVEILSNYGDPGNLLALAEVAFAGTEVLSIIDNNISDAISLYPNPATDILSISNSSTTKIENISIYDMNGRLVLNSEIRDNGSSQQINVSALSSGVYMLHMKGGQANAIKRLIKR